MQYTEFHVAILKLNPKISSKTYNTHLSQNYKILNLQLLAEVRMGVNKQNNLLAQGSLYLLTVYCSRPLVELPNLISNKIGNSILSKLFFL